MLWNVKSVNHPKDFICLGCFYTLSITKYGIFKIAKGYANTQEHLDTFPRVITLLLYVKIPFIFKAFKLIYKETIIELINLF